MAPLLTSRLAPPKCSSIGIRLNEAETYCGLAQYFGHSIAHEQFRLSDIYKESLHFGPFPCTKCPEILNLFKNTFKYVLNISKTISFPLFSCPKNYSI